MKAIDTNHNGYKFRSRLEARWAVFFDTLNIKYRYEDEGFDLDGTWYLPDFWIPEANCFVEIKPDPPKLVEYKEGIQPVDREEYRKCQKLAEHSKKVVLLVGGQPWATEILFGSDAVTEYEYSISVFVPKPLNTDLETFKSSNIPYFFILDLFGYSRISSSFYSSDFALFKFVSTGAEHFPDLFERPVPNRGEALGLVEADKRYFVKKFGRNHPFWMYGFSDSGFHFKIEQGKLILSQNDDRKPIDSVIWKAFKEARSARFERNGDA